MSADDKRAFLSVHNTKGLLELAGHLTTAGYALTCAVETASFLGRSGAEVAQVVSEANMSQFDLVVCDLFDFQLLMSQDGFTDERARKAMDIDQQAIILAAARNYCQTAIVCDLHDYPKVIEHLQQLGEITPDFRRHLGMKAFKNIAFHNFAVSAYIGLITPSKKSDPQQRRLPF